MSTGDVFLVDDNVVNIRLLAEILRGAGYQVRAATTGRRALDTIKTHPPELVLLDVNMPEMDGYQVCEALKADAKTRDIPTIFLSAHDTATEKVRAFQVGGVDYVTKPFEPEEVLARVATHLKVSRLQRETEARKAELEAALAELKQAQERIARLTASSSGMLEDPAAWARTISDEVAQAVGARAIGVFTVEGELLTPLVATDVPAPELASLFGSEPVDRVGRSSGPRELSLPDGEAPRLVVPVLGMTGELRGVVVVDGKAEFFRDAHRQLVASFVHHLGAALDLRRLRTQLTESETRRAATRAEMNARGIETVLLCSWCGRVFGEKATEARGDDLCPADRTPLDASYLLPYRVLGRYRLERLLGMGGMGLVFAATDERLGREVALKVIRAEYLNDVAMRLRLEREAQTVARISHPGVVALFDSGELEDGSRFLVMELLSGYDLDGMLARYGRGRPAQVATVLRQAGAALGAAHRAGVVHRDVKPANLFLTPLQGGLFTVKVVDFGLAAPIFAAGKLTMTGMIIGTPSYMSPEQALGKELDERSDVYSLAAVAYEALLGRRVAASEGPIVEVLHAIVNESPPAPSHYVAGLPPEVDQAFGRGLAKRALDRPRAIDVWAELLAKELEALPPGLGGVTGWPEGVVPGRGLARPRPRPAQ